MPSHTPAVHRLAPRSFHTFLRPLRPAGQASHGAGAAPRPPTHGAVAVAYVSGTCGACAKFLGMWQTTPSLIKAVEPRYIDSDPTALMEMYDVGANRTPTLVVFEKDGSRNVYQGPQAFGELVKLA